MRGECMAPSRLIGQEFGLFSPLCSTPLSVAYSAMQHKRGLPTYPLGEDSARGVAETADE